VPGGAFWALMLIDPQTGQVIAATNAAQEGTYQEDRPFFVNGKVGPYVQNVYHSVTLQGLAMTAAAPLRAPDGRLLKVLARSNTRPATVSLALGGSIAALSPVMALPKWST